MNDSLSPFDCQVFIFINDRNRFMPIPTTWAREVTNFQKQLETLELVWPAALLGSLRPSD